MIEFESDEQLAQMLAEGKCKFTALRDMAKNNQAGLTEAALRYTFANRDINGFRDAFIKLGSSIYIVDHRFWRCVLENRGKRLDRSSASGIAHLSLSIIILCAFWMLLYWLQSDGLE